MQENPQVEAKPEQPFRAPELNIRPVANGWVVAIRPRNLMELALPEETYVAKTPAQLLDVVASLSLEDSSARSRWRVALALARETGGAMRAEENLADDLVALESPSERVLTPTTRPRFDGRNTRENLPETLEGFVKLTPLEVLQRGDLAVDDGGVKLWVRGLAGFAVSHYPSWTFYRHREDMP